MCCCRIWRRGRRGRLGLGHADLAPRYPKLVVCDISGYGESGPFAQKKAYDLLIQAEGVDQRDGDRGGAVSGGHLGGGYRDWDVCVVRHPGRVGAARADGEGANVKIAMLDALAEWMMYPMNRYAYGGSGTPRSPTSHPLLAPYGAHRTKDGQVIFGLQNEREWATFCAKVLERPKLDTDARFRDNTAAAGASGRVDGADRRLLQRE